MLNVNVALGAAQEVVDVSREAPQVDHQHVLAQW